MKFATAAAFACFAFSFSCPWLLLPCALWTVHGVLDLIFADEDEE